MLLCSFIATFMALQVMIKVITSHASELLCKSHFLPQMQNLAFHNEPECILSNCFPLKHPLLATGECSMVLCLISFNNLEISVLALLLKSGAPVKYLV